MKVYIVMDYAVIEYEECTQVMGVFSSEDKAKEDLGCKYSLFAYI